MTDTKLKPCPFCGSHAVILKTDDTFPRYIVMCGNTVCPEQPMVETDSLEKCSFLWNSRPIEKKMKRDNVKLRMTNKLLKKRITRLQEALEVILDATKDEKPCITAINVVAYMALKEKE